MQRQFSATGLVTLLFILGAGVLLTAQLHITAADGWSGIPSWILWIVELSAYIAALLTWIPGISRPCLLLGLVAMLAMRAASAAGAGLVISFLQPAEHFANNFRAALGETLPRSCSIIFAIMAFYPVRYLLPRRSQANRLRERGAADTASPAAALPPAHRGGTFLFGAPGSQPGSLVAATPPAAANSNAARPPVVLSEQLRELKLAVPLRVIFPQLPAGVLKPELAERIFSDAMEVKVPLTAVLPQLGEALIQIPVDELLSYLPKAWLDHPMAGMEEKVILPLEVVVPQLPEEVLKLSDPCPPAWAAVVSEEEKVLFAQV